MTLTIRYENIQIIKVLKKCKYSNFDKKKSNK